MITHFTCPKTFKKNSLTIVVDFSCILRSQKFSIKNERMLCIHQINKMYNKRTFIFSITTGCIITAAFVTNTFHLTTLSIRRIFALVLTVWSIVSYFTRYRNIFKSGGQIDTSSKNKDLI